MNMNATQLYKQSGMPSVPGFLTKTFDILSAPENSACCGWGCAGETIVIKNVEQFSKDVLGQHFKHSTYQSFVRQLNNYGFRKTLQDPHHGEFAHKNFRQNQPELLVHIQRKPNKSKSPNPASLLEELVAETETLRLQLHQQRALREQFEQRVEGEMAALHQENGYLRTMFVESDRKNAIMQERMERVMKTLYTMFVGGVGNGSNSPGMALTNKAPSLLLRDVQHFLQQQMSSSTGTSSRSSIAMEEAQEWYDETEHELRNNSNSALEEEENRLLRLDSATLSRLPSFDMDELQSLPAYDTMNPAGYGSSMNNVNTTNNTNTTTNTAITSTNGNSATTNTNTTSDATNTTTTTTGTGTGTEWPRAGAALGDMKVTSFDIAASAVTAPSLQQQSSFDGAYLPIPDVYVPLMRNNSDTSGVGMAGEGCPHMPICSTNDTMYNVGKRKATEDAHDTTADNTSVGASGASGSSCSSGSNCLISPSKKLKGAWSQPEDSTQTLSEAAALGNEDVHSSLNKAQQFMHLLQRNQQTTLTRLDSLEQTIAFLFEGSDDAPLFSTVPCTTTNTFTNTTNTAMDGGASYQARQFQ